jgi:hypothetical protein
MKVCVHSLPIVLEKLNDSLCQRERVVGSCISFNISGYPDEFSGSARVSCSSSSVSSPATVYCSHMVPENITANASLEQPTCRCSSQESTSPSSPLPPRELSRSYRKGRCFLFNFIHQDIEPKHFFFFYMCACSCRFSCVLCLLYCNR